MYDNPERIQYDFGVIDFGTGSDILKTIPVPSGRSGSVKHILVRPATEDFAGATLDAGIQVGDGTDADKYFDTGRVLDETVDIADLAFLDLADDGSKVDIELDRSTVTVTFQSATNSPTGQAGVTVAIDWF